MPSRIRTKTNPMTTRKRSLHPSLQAKGPNPRYTSDMDPVPLAGIFVGFGLLVIVPVVAILTEHQRKMARILHGQSENERSEGNGQVVIGLHANLGGKKTPESTNNAVVDELRALRGELADLRMQVAGLQGSNPPGLPDDAVRSRLNQG